MAADMAVDFKEFGIASVSIWIGILLHEDNWGCPSDALLDGGGGGHTVEIRPPLLSFLGIAGQRHHAVTDGVARCLVAGGREQNEERCDLA